MVSHQTLCLTHRVRRYGEPEQLAAGLTTVSEARTAERVTRQDRKLYICSPIKGQDGEAVVR